MKLYRKKMLAMVLSIALILSMCCIDAFAADVNLYVGGTQQLYTISQTATWTSSNEAVATVSNGLVTAVGKGSATITATESGATVGIWQIGVSIDTSKPITQVTAQTRSLTVPYGTSLSVVETILNTISLTATYQDQGNQTVSANNWTCSPTYDPYYKGTYVFTPLFYNTVYGAAIDTITVTVGVAQIDVDFGGSTLEVPYGTSDYLVASALPTSATVKVMSGSTVLQTETWEIGDEFTDWVKYPGVGGAYVYATDLAYGLKGNYSYDSADLELSVVTKTAFSLDDLSTSMTYSGDYNGDTIELDYIVDSILEDQFYDWDVDIVSVDVDGYYKYGNVYNGDYTLDLTYNNSAYNSLMAGYNLIEEVPFIAQDYNENRYYGDINITITSGIRNYTYKMGASEFDFEFGKWIAAQISEDMVETLSYVEFYIEDGYGGTMYADKELNEFQEGEAYSYGTSYYGEVSELESLYFIPDGTQNYYDLEYVAFGKYNEILEGKITIECREFLMIRDTIGTDEYLTFDSSDFVEMISNSSYYSYDLISIDSLRVSGGGNLYYDYVEGTNRPTPVNRNTDYYVDTTNSTCIDYISYVPADNAKSSTVTITFKLNLKDGSRSQSPTGIYQINVIEKADITIQTGIGQSVDVDYELFKEFCKNNVSNSKSNYDIAYIVFKNAPASKSEGYLYANGIKILNPDSEAFYTDNKDDGDYPMDSLTFVGGNTAKTTQAQFTIFGKRYANSNPTKLVEGTIDFEVGTSNTIDNAQSPMKASQLLPFSYELAAFEALGGNDNVYIEFTSLPKGGKLYYNYGLSTQKDVTIGTAYYITSASGEQLLRNVTFVPSYSVDKAAKTISFDVKGYNKNGKSVTGTVNISVIHAYSSLYFSDITSSLYADSVDFLYNQGITKGIPGGKYDAAGKLSRAELVTFLYRAAGQPNVFGVSKFTDVSKTEYYYDAVLWATQVGITKGTNAAGTLFSPNAKVTNQEIIQFMYNYDVKYLKHTAYVTGSSSYVYDYSQVADWAQTAIQWAVGKSVLTPGYLYPTTVGIRGDIALYLHRMLTL